MSTKATVISRSANKAVANSRKATREAKAFSRISKLAKDANNAAVAAACAAERVGTSNREAMHDATTVQKLAEQIEAVAELAVEKAKEAMQAESEGDAVTAILAANLSARAAQRASMLSSAAAVLHGKAKAMATAEKQFAVPEVMIAEEDQDEDGQRSELMRQELKGMIDQSARYVVTYNSRIIAMFAREDDAFLLESELADIDCAHHATSGCCEVLDRKTWHRLGGYLMSDGKIVMFLRDEDHDGRFGGKHS